MKWAGDGFAPQKEQVWDCAIVYPPALPKMDCNSPVKDGEDFSAHGCCQKRSSVCFKKNDHWASCMDKCWTNKVWEDGQWVEKDNQVWDCGVIEPKNITPARLYAMSDVADAAASSQPSVASRPLLAALALGNVAGGSDAVFRRAQLREVPQEDSAEE